MTIVTSGPGASDIDALACAVTYAELLRLQGKDSAVALYPEFTSSVTQEIRNWPLPKIMDNTKLGNTEAEYVVVDFSNAELLKQIIPIEKVMQIFDHHFFGYEAYWQKILQEKFVIETVGACASLIWRESRDASRLNEMSELSARLLFTAIVSNTLNLQAGVTCELDRQALSDLANRTGLEEGWIGNYYAQIESEVLSDAIGAIRQDTRIYDVKGKHLMIGQMELWDGLAFVNNNYDALIDFLNSDSFGKNDGGFLTIPSIKDGINYLIFKNAAAQKLLTKKIPVLKAERYFKTEKLFLRKELIKMLNN